MRFHEVSLGNQHKIWSKQHNGKVSTNLRRVAEPTHLLLEWSTPEGQQTGLLHDSVVSCNNLATVHEDRIDRAIGQLPPALMRRISECLKAALGLL